MTVIAGCSLFDGILLAADCRVTVRRNALADVYADNAQKLFAIAPHTAIGFCGDVKIAGDMLNELTKKYEKKKRKDPISFMNWISRFFKREFSQNGKHDVIFMVGSVLRGQNNVIERQKVVELANYIFFGNGPIKRRFIPNIIAEILKVPPEYTYVEIPNTSMGLLYVMRSPNFAIEICRPLQFAAIGSGESVHEEIYKYQDSIFALEPGNSFVESMQFRETIRRFIDEQNIPSVGGLYPALKISGKGIEYLGQGITIQGAKLPLDGTRIELSFRDGRWYQKNLTVNKEIMLLYPWEINASRIKKDHTFNDLNIALGEFRTNKD